MVIRQYVEKLEGDDFTNAQAQAWVDIRQFMEEDVTPMLAEQNRPGGSVNGPGSSLDCTTGLVAALPGFLRRHHISSLLDAPCGDWTWMRHVDLAGVIYLGWDVDIEQIRRNREQFERIGDGRQAWFFARNILTVPRLPVMDAILCRDFLAHLPTEHITAVLDKFKNSRCIYLLASNYPGVSNEFDYRPEDFAWLGYCERAHDLEQAPFHLSKIDALPEIPGPGGVISLPHELALFRLN
jgi:hypothetical protein